MNDYDYRIDRIREMRARSPRIVWSEEDKPFHSRAWALLLGIALGVAAYITWNPR